MNNRAYVSGFVFLFSQIYCSAFVFGALLWRSLGSHVPELVSDPQRSSVDRRKWGIRWIFGPVWPASSLQRRISMWHMYILGSIIVCGCTLELLSLSVWRTQFDVWMSFLRTLTSGKHSRVDINIEGYTLKLWKIIFPITFGQYIRISIVILGTWKVSGDIYIEDIFFVVTFLSVTRK